MTLFPYPFFILAALLCAFIPYRVALGIAVLSFVLVAAPMPLTYLACSGSRGGCSGVPAGLVIALFAPVLLGALAGMLWQARRSLTATDLRQLPGWQKPSKTIRAAYTTVLAVVALTAGASLFGHFSLAGSSRAVGAMLWWTLLGGLPATVVLCACATRVRSLFVLPDALWLPEAGVRIRAASLAVMCAGALALSALKLAQHVFASKLGQGPLLIGTAGASLLGLLGLCAFEVSRANAVRRSSPPDNAAGRSVQVR